MLNFANKTQGQHSQRPVTMAVLTAASLGALHHLDHLVRGDAGWPATGEVNAFTYSLAMYPVVAFELYLAHRGRNMRRYRMTVAVVAFALVAAVHFGPVATDRLSHVYASYDPPLLGGAAVSVVLALLASLIALFVLVRRSPA